MLKITDGPTVEENKSKWILSMKVLEEQKPSIDGAKEEDLGTRKDKD